MSVLPFALLAYIQMTNQRELDEQPFCWICETYINSTTKQCNCNKEREDGEDEEVN